MFRNLLYEDVCSKRMLKPKYTHVFIPFVHVTARSGEAGEEPCCTLIAVESWTKWANPAVHSTL